MFRELVVAIQAKRDEHDRTITLAWQINALHRQAKLPKLETLLAKRERPTQTVEGLRTVLHMLSDQYGGRVRKAAPKRRGKKTPRG